MQGLCLTKAQLLGAELVGANGVEIGDVAQVDRAANGSVSRLLVKIEDSNPERYIHVILASLAPLVRGNDTDLSTAMTRADLEALPAVQLRSYGRAAAAAGAASVDRGQSRAIAGHG